MENEFNIQEYLADGVEYIVKNAMKATLRNPKESLFLLRFSKHAKKATGIRQDYEDMGHHIPVFLIASMPEESRCYGRTS